MGPEHFYYGGWWMFPMMMPFLIFVIFLIVLYLMFRRGGFVSPWCGGSGKSNTHGWGSESALDILKKRYAKGEINKEEFEQMKKDLET